MQLQKEMGVRNFMIKTFDLFDHPLRVAVVCSASGMSLRVVILDLHEPPLFVLVEDDHPILWARNKGPQKPLSNGATLNFEPQDLFAHWMF